MTEPGKPFVNPVMALAVGIAAISTGAIFARAADAPSLVIAAYRVGLATLILAPFAAWKCPGEIAGLSRSDWKSVLGAGFFLAVHFATWIASLDYTSVASSVILVETIPLWVGVLTPFVTGERPGRATLAGIGLSVALMGIGGVLLIVDRGALPIGVTPVADLPRDLARLQAGAYLSLGLIVLIATPFVRVAGSIVAFAYERDRRYVLITALVLVVMCLSVLLGRA